MLRAPPLLAALVLLVAASAFSSAADVPVCDVSGHSSIDGACAWPAPLPSSGNATLRGKLPNSRLPVVIFNDSSVPSPPAPAAPGFFLTLKRLMLVNVSLAPPPGTPSAPPGVPLLAPLRLFQRPPSNVSLTDVRMLVAGREFARLLSFFSERLRVAGSASDTGVGLFTDNTSFMAIPYWVDPSGAELRSVTLLSGPCNPAPGLPPDTLADLGLSLSAAPGCNVRSVINATLVPTLLRDATLDTPQPLYVRVMSNVSLGAGLAPGAIAVRRPVVLAGLASVVTSVDFGMVVNQLNVTGPHSKLVWNSLVLENVSPGDAISSTVAPPYSTAASGNLWPMYCNRSSGAVCLTLANCTIVLPSVAELQYLNYMWSMFNSPLPSLKGLTSFYVTDLHVTALQFVPAPGPSNDSLLLIRLDSLAWHVWYVLFTTTPVVAPPLPSPIRAVLLANNRAGPLAQAVQSCDSVQAALAYNASGDRVHLWMLLTNVSLGAGGQLSCSWPVRRMTSTTEIFGEKLDSATPHPPLLPETPQTRAPVPVPVPQPAQPAPQPTPAGARPPPPPPRQLFTLSFGFVAGVFQLPPAAPDGHVAINNITLQQLPQGPGAAAASGGAASRALLQLGSRATPPEIWALLMWPFNRSLSGSPLFVTEATVLLPRPEYEVLAQAAAGAGSFALQLLGAMGLTFTGVYIAPGAVHVGSFSGPGISGANLRLMADATLPPGHVWPAGVAAAPAASSLAAGAPAAAAGSSTAVAAAVGASVGALCLLLLGACCLGLLWRRRRRRQHAALAVSVSKGGSSGKREQHTGAPSQHAAQPHAASFAGSSLVVDASLPSDQHSRSCLLCAEPLPARPGAVPAAAAATEAGAAPAAGGLRGKRIASAGQLQAIAGSGGGSGSEGSAVHTAAQPLGRTSGGGLRRASTVNCATLAAALAAGDSTDAPRTPEQPADPIAAGLQRWKAAVSSTTLQLMERRMQAAQHSLPASASAASSGDAGWQQQQWLLGSSEERAPAAASAAAGDSASQLALLKPIGRGSFGSVYLGAWRGKRVAVKVMQLPANALLEPEPLAPQQLEGQHGAALPSPERARLRRARQRAQNSPPHMAIMEAVVSSTMAHPNVVQVFTYMLSPLTSSSSAQGGSSGAQAAGTHSGQALASGAGVGEVFGWSLKLVMEYCDEGTLRDALDLQLLPRVCGTPFVQPAIVLALAHDVAAAMLHLHSEGIVHGDLKAGNVLLTSSGGSASAAAVWRGAGGARPLTAKVADFGLALPLGPSDTHATLMARGTPTHMSPELFMAGHVSKASDVYAYGILLYEIMTGRRAYAGVPIPLLPHEVARQGLRPEWPPGLPPGCRDLRMLAEACWAQEPRDRPSFKEAFSFLEAASSGAEPSLVRSKQQVQTESDQSQEVLSQQLVSLQDLAAQQLRQLSAHAPAAQQHGAPPPPPSSPHGAAGAAPGAHGQQALVVPRPRAAAREQLEWSEVAYH